LKNSGYNIVDGLDKHAHPQYSIDCSSIEHLSEGTGTLLEDGNIMPKHVGATIYN
jgi:hypothetical protein